MKTRRFLAVFVGTAFLMFAGGRVLAQDRHDRDERHEHQWDRDRPVFDEHERVVVNGWWGERHPRTIVGFRVEDRLPRDWEPRLQVGFVLDNGWRHRMHPVPVELYRRLPPPPRHFAYYVIGGHVCLVDQRDWRVADVIHIEL
jgi:Ni/Co efflux regulator RcnB